MLGASGSGSTHCHGKMASMAHWQSIEDSAAYARHLLRGDNVVLRPLREDDLPILEGWWADTELSLLRQGVVQPQPAGRAAEMFRQWSVNTDPGSAGFSVAEHSSGELLGHVSLYVADVRSRSAMLAIIIGPGHAGRGYGSDALEVLMRYGFEEMGLHRIELRTWAFNDRALATYSKAGFVEEGRRREAVHHAGSFHDEVLMGLLEQEWRARP